MKKYIFNIVGITALLFVSCNDVLDEQPRSVLTPDLFTTTKGIQAGLTAAYDGLRYISGAQAPQFSTEYGTDEFTGGEGNNNSALDMTTGANPIDASTGDISTYWSNLFPFINTCNGIIKYGSESGMSESLIAEAHFLRAYYYFLQVQSFGGVPLDLGSGELEFNTSQSNLSHRNTEEEVYAAIINDMKYAEEYLPVSPRLPGCAFQATAIHFLAKIYLTRDKSGDAQLALTEAEKLINATAPYTVNAYNVALLPTYAEVIRPTNERNSEILFTCEHTETYEFNETAAGFGSGPSGKDDRSLSYYTPNYANFKLRNNDAGGFLQRTVEYQRPWMRLTSTHGLRHVIFVDKTNDSRYHATFQTVYLNNNSAAQNGLLDKPLNPGDTAFVFSDTEVSQEYRATKNYRIFAPDEIDRYIYPPMRKHFDPNRQDPNDASGRPFILAKLSETYLIAAEAAMKLSDNTKARNYILALRKRAAYPGHEQDIVDDTPPTITIGYILDERSRELCGEQHRWFDLKRTKTWKERAATYSINGTNSYTRDIKDHYYLRPIPQSQIDLMGNSENDKDAYQNPNY